MTMRVLGSNVSRGIFFLLLQFCADISAKRFSSTEVMFRFNPKIGRINELRRSPNNINRPKRKFKENWSLIPVSSIEIGGVGSNLGDSPVLVHLVCLE
jgi:hypothetical protein